MNRSFPLSPPPNHTPLYLLPLAHGPTMSYIGWVQAGGAWALRVLSFQICPRVCLLLMCLPQPGDSPPAFPGLSCGLSFGLSLQSGAGSRMIMDFTFLWPIFGFLYCLPRRFVIPAVMTQSCWTPFWAGRLSLFSVACHRHCFVFTHGLLCPFGFPFGHPRPIC